MLVPRMTDDEILKEISLDINGVRNYLGSIMHKYTRHLIKTNVSYPYYFNTVEYKTLRKNNVLINIYAETKKDKDSLRFNIVFYYTKPDGIYVISMVPGDDIKILICPPHFYMRYKERYLKNDMTSIEVIKYYLKYNPSCLLKPSEKENIYIGTTNHGVVFLKRVNKRILVFKTFITEKQLFESQISEQVIRKTELIKINTEKVKHKYENNWG